jgi:hypothetical protein
LRKYHLVRTSREGTTRAEVIQRPVARDTRIKRSIEKMRILRC